MTISYALGFEPLWILVDLNGTVAGGGYIQSSRSLNKSQPKPIFDFYNEPYTNPVIFDLNGVAPGPFYFQVDSSDPEETYFLQAFNAAGDELWTVDGYLPGSSGGGSDVTVNVPLNNYIANNQFLNHIPTTTSTSLTNLIVAPSNHQGFTPAPSTALAIAATYGVVGPDIRFVKNTTVNTDEISFPNFALGSSALTGDVTPVRYCRYLCSTANAGETYKSFQFPITQKVQNLSNQAMTFRFWAMSGSGTPILNLYTRQYYGNGTGATAESASTRALAGSRTLTTGWAVYNISFTMPDVSGKTIGTPGSQTDDDAVYLQLDMPLNQTCDVRFTKPELYLGTINPSIEFESYDQINSIDSTPRCGDVKTGYSAAAPLGWLLMNDTTIGNTGSGATTAGDFTFQLYSTLYTAVNNTYAPVSTGRTGGGTTMANAVTDFLAGKTLTLPLALGRAMAGAGAGAGLTARVPGQNVGAETISISAMPAHTHAAPSQQFALAQTGGGGAFVSGGSITNFTFSATTASTGGGAADGNMEPTTFMNFYIKL